MSVTRDSSVTAGYATSSTSSDGSVSSTAYVDQVNMELGSGSGEGEGSGLIFSGDATAVGTDTLAQMVVDATVADNGSSSTLSLSADLLAAAAAADYDPFAATTIWFGVIGPVDSYIQIEELETFTASGPNGTVTVQSASLDFDGIVLGGAAGSSPGPASQPAPYLDGSTPTADPYCDCGSEGGDADFVLDGNLAVFVFHADAFGEDSYASLIFDALAVEDSLSTIVGVLEVAVG